MHKLVAGRRWLLAGGAVLMVGALFFCLGLSEWLELRGLDERFRQQGRTVQGTVLTKAIVSSSGGGTVKRPQSSNPNYHVAYRFRTPEGKELEGSAHLYSETWHSLAESGPIQIAYLADEPLINRTEGQTDPGSAAVGMLMGGLLALAGAVLLVLVWRGVTPRSAR